MSAQALYAGLDDRSCVVLARFELPVRDLGLLLGVGHTQAAVLRTRLTARLAEELGALDEAEETVLELRKLCECWLQDRTNESGVALSTSRDGTPKGDT